MSCSSSAVLANSLPACYKEQLFFSFLNTSTELTRGGIILIIISQGGERSSCGLDEVTTGSDAGVEPSSRVFIHPDVQFGYIYPCII